MKNLNQAVDVQGLAAQEESTGTGTISNVQVGNEAVNADYSENSNQKKAVKKLNIDGDNWVGTYDPESKIMIGGYGFDEENCSTLFEISEVDEENAVTALKLCASLFAEYGMISLSLNGLKKLYDEHLCLIEALNSENCI